MLPGYSIYYTPIPYPRSRYSTYLFLAPSLGHICTPGTLPLSTIFLPKNKTSKQTNNDKNPLIPHSPASVTCLVNSICWFPVRKSLINQHLKYYTVLFSIVSAPHSFLSSSVRTYSDISFFFSAYLLPKSIRVSVESVVKYKHSGYVS